jgi:micrococcal nuclease
MKKAFIFLLFLFLATGQICAEDQGTVVVVYDGDTIRIKFDSGEERKVRLIGIDTAEIGETPHKAPLEALLAKRFTFHHLFRQRVKLTYENEKEDRFGRLLAYVWKENRLFNRFILEKGFARVFYRFSYALKDEFIRAHEKAVSQGRGFWKNEPYPLVRISRIRDNIGKLVRVRFTCRRIRESGRVLFMQPLSGDFAALVQTEYLPLFGDIRGMEGKTIEVFGFLEEYRGQPQIMLFFPSQIETRPLFI